MLEAPLDVDRAAVGAGQRPRRRDVDRRADQRDHEDQPGAHVRRRDEAVDRLVDDQQREHEQRDAVGLRGEHLHAAQAVGHRAARRPARERDRREREGERRRIGEHVGGVREQGERVREHARDHLRAHQSRDQAERDRQAPRAAVAAHRRQRAVMVRGALVPVAVVAHPSDILAGRNARRTPPG